MNKKFSTLLAGAALLGAVTANAGGPVKTVAADGLYQLAVDVAGDGRRTGVYAERRRGRKLLGGGAGSAGQRDLSAAGFFDVFRRGWTAVRPMAVRRQHL